MAKLSKPKIPYTQVANEVLNDKKLSLKAKGSFAYLFSKPEDWDFAAKRIAGDSMDGERSVKSALKELENAGYLTRKRQATGRVEYFLKFTAEPKGRNAPLEEKATSAFQHSAKTAPVSNKEKKVIKINTAPDAGAGKDAIEIIDLFKDLTSRDLFGNKTERAAAQRLAEKYGLEKMRIAVDAARMANKTPYSGITITTPWQLEKNIDKLRFFVIKEQKKNSRSKEIVDVRV